MEKTTFTAEHEGKTFKRTSQSYRYTHVVIAQNPIHPAEKLRTWHHKSWCSRIDLAEKEARGWQKYGYETKILPVTAAPATRAKGAQA